MIDWLEKIDQELFLFLNGLHSPFFDQVMWVISAKATWIPLYLVLLYLLYRNYQKEWFFWLIGIGLLILVTDQITSSLLKPFIGRLRPCHDPEINYLVHNVKKCGGLYGFVSGHSSNSFAIAIYFFLLFKNRFAYIWLLFIWAAIVAYSRVYLGVHYPGDIFTGGLLGILFGWLIYRFSSSMINRYQNKKSK